jgi:small subunit ribosomal protein S27Ae
MFGGRQLEEDCSLEAAGVSDDSQMYILMRLLGGVKKRKKKTYTKPKKQKHK